MLHLYRDTWKHLFLDEGIEVHFGVLNDCSRWFFWHDYKKVGGLTTRRHFVLESL